MLYYVCIATKLEGIHIILLINRVSNINDRVYFLTQMRVQNVLRLRTITILFAEFRVT